MVEKIKLTAIFSVSPLELYNAWLESKKHSKMTGDKAQIDPKIGGLFTAGDGYISGKNLELIPGKRILQAWRTTEFPPDSPDSKLELLFEPNEIGTKLTLIQTEIPDRQGDYYKDGWKEFYFDPMKKVLNKKKTPKTTTNKSKKTSSKKITKKSND